MKKTILLFAALTFFTLENKSQTLTDIDGNNYNTIAIGTQEWMEENLKVTHYRDGSIIPNDTSATVWANLSTGARCYYNNDSNTNAMQYGVLYNWYAVSSFNLCPSGWHVPTDDEWTTLTDYLINNGYGFGGTGNKISKSMAATTDWLTLPFCSDPGNEALICADMQTNNSSKFTALPGGYRWDISTNAEFYGITFLEYWWSSSTDGKNPWYRSLAYYGDTPQRYSGDKTFGFAIRCVKDSLGTQINEKSIDQDIQIFPNPAIDLVYIDCAEKNDIKMQVYNIIGNCVFQNDLSKGTNIIDISFLTNGIYIIHLSGADITFQQKLVKE